ncbi:hypothetical protein AX15_003875 [Amanita polypyramis BW_CC]|nr:hypothetical protein AX15_003875 [Amanita polypyramis BW_CC]
MVTPNDIQRLYLQSILSRGLVSEPLAKLLWKKCIAAVDRVDNALDLPDPDNADAWTSFLSKIIKSLDDLNLDFRRLVDESTGQPCYVIVNAKSDEIAQMATDYNPAEIAYFRALVEQIMLAPRQSFSISSLAALREISTIKPKSNMTKTQAEVVLASFVARGWLLRSRRHSACSQCGRDWPAEAKDKSLAPVGEDAARDGDDARRRVRVQSAEPSEEEMENEREAPQSQSQARTQPQTQRSQRTRGNRRQDTSMDIDDEDYADGSQRRSTRSQARRAGSRR